MANRKPDEVKKIQGTLRKCRVNKDAPKLPKGWPTMPEDWDDQHKAVFTEFCKVAEKMNVLTEADQHSVILFVESYCLYRKLAEVIANEGYTYEVEGRNGKQIKTRPEVSMMNQCWKQCYMMLSHFGLSPATRQQLKVTPEKPDKPEAQKRYEAKLKELYQ